MEKSTRNHLYDDILFSMIRTVQISVREFQKSNSSFRVSVIVASDCLHRSTYHQTDVDVSAQRKVSLEQCERTKTLTAVPSKQGVIIYRF